MKRTARAAVATAAAVLLVTACAAPADQGTTTAAGTAEPAAAEEGAVITFMNWYYEDGWKAAYEDFTAAFQEEHPALEAVRVETQPFAQYNDILQVKLASGEPPSAAWLLSALAPAFVDSGRLLDLMPYIEQTPGFDLDDFDPNALAPWMRGDELYALPFTNAGSIVFYNVDAFEEAGLDTPKELQARGEWTWDNLRTTANALVDAEASRFGFWIGENIYTNGWRYLADVYAPYGARPWSEDGSECLFDSPETVAATTLVHSMIYEDGSFPEPGVDVDFASGDLGMSLDRLSLAPRLEDVPFEWEVIRAPEGPAGFVPSLEQNGIGVFVDGPNPELAAEWVINTLTPESAARFSENVASARQSLQGVDTLAPINPLLTPEQLEDSIIPTLQADEFELAFSHPEYLELSNEAQLVFDGEIWTPDAEVEAALQGLCDRIEPSL